MSGIHFRDIKNKRTIDASFCLFNGNDISTATQHWHVGDVVHVCFDGQDSIAASIAQDGPDQLLSAASSGFIQIPCVVVQRSHCIVWKSIGQFQHLTDAGVILEAKDGLWEDVLLWIMKGNVPNWVPTEAAEQT